MSPINSIEVVSGLSLERTDEIVLRLNSPGDVHLYSCLFGPRLRTPVCFVQDAFQMQPRLSCQRHRRRISKCS